MIENFTSVLEPRYRSGSVNRFRRGIKEPAGGCQLMTAELRHQAFGVLLVHSPVEKVFPIGISPLCRVEIRRRFLFPAPGRIAMPGQPCVIHITEDSGLMMFS